MSFTDCKQGQPEHWSHQSYSTADSPACTGCNAIINTSDNCLCVIQGMLGIMKQSQERYIPKRWLLGVMGQSTCRFIQQSNDCRATPAFQALLSAKTPSCWLQTLCQRELLLLGPLGPQALLAGFTPQEPVRSPQACASFNTINKLYKEQR